MKKSVYLREKLKIFRSFFFSAKITILAKEMDFNFVKITLNILIKLARCLPKINKLEGNFCKYKEIV
jgi:hypothetical protein